MCIHHGEEGHYLAGVMCACGWTVYESPDVDDLEAAWWSHVESSPRGEWIAKHPAYGGVYEWIVDVPTYEEWYCSRCGEAKP